jgi:hypothetical protein
MKDLGEAIVSAGGIRGARRREGEKNEGVSEEAGRWRLVRKENGIEKGS